MILERIGLLQKLIVGVDFFRVLVDRYIDECFNFSNGVGRERRIEQFVQDGAHVSQVALAVGRHLEHAVKKGVILIVCMVEEPPVITLLDKDAVAIVFKGDHPTGHFVPVHVVVHFSFVDVAVVVSEGVFTG